MNSHPRVLHLEYMESKIGVIVHRSVKGMRTKIIATVPSRILYKQETSKEALSNFQRSGKRDVQFRSSYICRMKKWERKKSTYCLLGRVKQKGMARGLESNCIIKIYI